ncbi:response regulator transcription factor [Lebetimonas sp. JH369]|uniref:response regulator transcription factor n=1 Tax=Lebetimonas sp. JH369 TaxID=990069 RepID=UPI000464BE9C|nr:response regulator transcription factor [Lebetimonas sp. JH369]
MKILLVEDDEFIGESIKEYFEMSGNKVDYYSTPKRALEKIYPEHYDIYLLDINMPEMNGYEFYKGLKNYSSSTPVIFITAYSDVEHIEKAFNIGAADYIKKPFDLKELELRIKRLVFKKTDRIKITANYSFDIKKLKLFYNDKEVELTPNEKYFLEILVKNINNVVDSETIKDYVWEEKAICDNTLRTQVKKLRSKLKENFIKNVRGCGYKIEKKQ